MTQEAGKRIQHSRISRRLHACRRKSVKIWRHYTNWGHSKLRSVVNRGPAPRQGQRPDSPWQHWHLFAAMATDALRQRTGQQCAMIVLAQTLKDNIMALVRHRRFDLGCPAELLKMV